MSTAAHQPKHFSAGLLAQRQDQHELAVRHYQQAIASGDKRPEVLLNLAVALANTGCHEAAELIYLKLIKKDPNNAAAWTNLGNLQCKLRQFEKAEQAHRKALALNPDDILCWYNAGNVPFHSNRPEAALYYFNEVLARNPRHQGARWNRALALLQLERWQAGFAGYEARLEKHQNIVKQFSGAYWQGQPLDGKTLLLTTEQGYGDVIQFARYCLALKQRFTVRIILQVRPALRRLMMNCPGIDEVILNEDSPPAFDYYFPLLSLARMLELGRDLLPLHAYLQAPDIQSCKPKVQQAIANLQASKKLKIGINWQGKLTPYNRGVPLAQLARLMVDERFDFYAIQQGQNDAITQAGLGLFVQDLGTAIEDFADTAALMSHLDLIISIDSAPAHLAGALNIPCFLMLLEYNDWRWHLTREDSPWYPKMRLIRQKQHGEWHRVIERIAEELGVIANNNVDINSFFAQSRS